MTIIGTFDTGRIGTFDLFKKRKPPKGKQNKNGKYHCSNCKVSNDDEEVLIDHIMGNNDCNASHYKIRA